MAIWFFLRPIKLLVSVTVILAITVSSLAYDFFDGLASHLSNSFCRSEIAQAFEGCFNDIDLIVASEALRADILDTRHIHNGTNRTA